MSLSKKNDKPVKKFTCQLGSKPMGFLVLGLLLAELLYTEACIKARIQIIHTVPWMERYAEAYTRRYGLEFGGYHEEESAVLPYQFQRKIYEVVFLVSL